MACITLVGLYRRKGGIDRGRQRNGIPSKRCIRVSERLLEIFEGGTG